MIEGLKFDVTSAELVAHLSERVTHHIERAAFYASQSKALEDGNAEGMNYSGGDPVRALKDKRSEHEHKKELFEFLVAHVISGETYRLTESDLLQLEIISRHARW